MEGDVLTRLDDEVRRNCRFEGRRVDRLGRVTRVTGATPAQIENLVMWSDVDEASADAEIAAQVAYFAGIGHAFEWLVYGHDRPPDLVERLRARGGEFVSSEAVLVAEAAAVGEAPAPEGIEVRAITDPARVLDALAPGGVVWGMAHHDFVLRWLTEIVRDRPEEGIVLAAYAGDRPVGAGWSTLWADRAFAPLFGGVVLPEWRGRGIYRALVAARARAAAARGIRWCVVDANTDSAPILQRIGFTQITTRTHMGWSADTR